MRYEASAKNRGGNILGRYPAHPRHPVPVGDGGGFPAVALALERARPDAELELVPPMPFFVVMAGRRFKPDGVALEDRKSTRLNSSH